MDKQQLNNLVVLYQNGDKIALNEIFRKINPLIEKESLEMEKFIDDFTVFDCRVLKEIERLAKSFEKDKHDFLSAVKAVISRTKSQYIRRNSRKSDLYVSMEFLAEPQRDELGYQFEDTLANVEDELLLKEKIALLAQGDSRKTVILNEWSKGADDKSISVLLAQRFGGKAESHRKFIQRFKTKECRPFFEKDVSSA